MENEIKILSNRELAIELRKLRYSQQKIYLIKLVKEQTKIGLKEARNLVEELWHKPTALFQICLQTRLLNNVEPPTSPVFAIETCRGEYAKVRLIETQIQDAGVLSIEEGTGFFVCAILSKTDLRKLRDKITEIINMPVIKL